MPEDLPVRTCIIKCHVGDHTKKSNWFLLVHWFIGSLGHCDSLSYWFMSSLRHWLIQLFHRLIISPINSHSLNHWFTASLRHWFIVGFMDSVLRPFVDSLIHRLIVSLIHSVSCPWILYDSFMSCHRHLNNNLLIVDASHNFNISLLLHFNNIPVSRLLPIVISYFRNFPRRVPGTLIW
jgi:hypothetical protein